VIRQIAMNPEFASEVSLAFGMLLADAMVVFGEAGFIGPSDRIDNHPDGVRLIWPRLLDGRLVAKIPSRDMAFFLRPRSALSRDHSRCKTKPILHGCKPREQLGSVAIDGSTQPIEVVRISRGSTCGSRPSAGDQDCNSSSPRWRGWL
jgi:hypothetical protein